MNGDGINFDQSDVENDEEIRKIRKNLAKARKEFFIDGKCNVVAYGSSKRIKSN